MPFRMQPRRVPPSNPLKRMSRRLEQMVAFEKIYAPFDGVMTARNTDIGQLIDSGSSGGPTRELFHIAAVDRLRVFVNVPQVYSHAATPGVRADLTVPELPGRHFSGNTGSHCRFDGSRHAHASDRSGRGEFDRITVSRLVHRSAFQNKISRINVDHSFRLSRFPRPRACASRLL